VKPAGVNKLGYKSEIAPVLIPLMGSVMASVLTIMTASRPMRLRRERYVVFINL
jgi:hypothetical protein